MIGCHAALSFDYFIDEGSEDSSGGSADEDEEEAGGGDVLLGCEEGDHWPGGAGDEPDDEICVRVDGEVAQSFVHLSILRFILFWWSIYYLILF